MERVDDRRLRILYVDDDEAVRLAIGRKLRRAFDVDVVGDAAAVEAAVRANSYDAFVTDLDMPVDGVETIRRVSLIDPRLARRAVILTASAFSDGDRDQSAVREFVIVTKGTPTQFQDVVDAVQRLALTS